MPLVFLFDATQEQSGRNLFCDDQTRRGAAGCVRVAPEVSASRKTTLHVRKVSVSLSIGTANRWSGSGSVVGGIATVFACRLSFDRLREGVEDVECRAL